MKRKARTTSRHDWLGLAATGLALAACYGTLAVVIALSALGVSLRLHDGAWAAAIALFTLVAVGAMALGWRRHGRRAPSALAFAGGALIFWVMFGSYSPLLELAGFAALVGAAIWDWRLGRA